MRNGFLFLFLLTVLILFQTGCKKGDNGAAGVAGTNGTSLLNGNGPPAAETGSDGDFYLDTSAQILYGPKTAGGWGAGVLLKGNANVMIDTFRVSSSDWQYSATYYVGTSSGISTGFTARYFDHAESGITQELLNTGIVQAYFTSEPDLNQNNWTPLPYSFITYGGYQYNYAAETNVGTMRFYFYFNKITADPPDLPSYSIPDIKFKIVLLPGNIIGEMTGQKQKASLTSGN